MLVALISFASTAVTAGFGYWRYYAYMKTVRHVVDKLGADGLARVDKIAPPTLASAVSARRVRT